MEKGLKFKKVNRQKQDLTAPNALFHPNALFYWIGFRFDINFVQYRKLDNNSELIQRHTVCVLIRNIT